MAIALSLHRYPIDTWNPLHLSQLGHYHHCQYHPKDEHKMGLGWAHVMGLGWACAMGSGWACAMGSGWAHTMGWGWACMMGWGWAHKIVHTSPVASSSFAFWVGSLGIAIVVAYKVLGVCASVTGNISGLVSRWHQFLYLLISLTSLLFLS